VKSASDVIVIGAGIVGCAVAYDLSRRGASVTVVDDRPAGMGATQAAAGVLAPYIEARENPPLTELAARSLAIYDAFVARVTADSGLPVTYRRTGTLDVAMTDGERNGLAAAARDLESRGVEAQLLDAGAVRGEEPRLADAAVGGLYIPCHGFVAASELTRALAGAAARHGAQMVASRATRISRSGKGLAVTTNDRGLTAGAVVLAAGSWSSQVVIDGVEPRAPIRPVRGQLLQLAWKGRPLRRVTWSGRCYLVPWDEGTLLVGATVEDVGFDERATVTGVRQLLAAACDLFPETAAAAFTAARVGLRPASIDGLPVIGASGVMPQLTYATGHYRNGILLAPLTAQLVADAILDRHVDPLLTLTSPQRFGAL